MFNKNQIVFIFLLLYLSAVYAEITQIKGYLFDIFKGTNGRDYDIKYIINCFNEKKNILKNDSGNYNLTIEFSQSDNYNDYVEEVKNEIKKDNYHFFLIDYKTLINDYTYYLNINNSVSDTFFYTQTIQIDEYCNIEESEYHHSNHIILDDCKINGNYYALPFTSSYNFLFYNNKLLKEFNININNNPSWSDIKNVVDEYNKNNSGNVKYGITLGLKEEEDFTGFMLEFLFSNRNISYKKCLNYNSSIVKYKDKQYFSYGECNNNNYEIFFNEYGIGNAYKEFKNLLQNNYIHPESRDLDEKQALEKFLNGESFFLRGSYDVFKEITNRNNGVTSINNDINVNTVTTTTKAPPPVTATTKAPPSSQQTTTIMNLPPKLPPKTPQTTQTISSNTIQKRNYGKVIFDNSGEYNFGVSLLPSNFSTYKGYALIGNNHQKFKDIRKAIVDVMSVLVSEQAQIKLAHDYDFLPSFDYSFYGTSVLTSLCDIIPCQTYLNSINALSLTKTLFNEESVSNSIIDSDLRNTFFEYQSKPSNEEDQYLNDSALKTLKYDLSLSYVKWLDIKSIISIVYFAFGNLYAILLIIIIAIRLVQKNNVIMQASPYLKIFYIIGLTFFFDISVLRPGFPSNLICKLGHNINYLLLGIALCCYFMKVWKINIVVNNYKFKIFNYKLTEKSSQYICSIFLSLIVTLNIFWEIFSPRTIGIKTVVIEKGNDTLKYRTPICTSEHEQLFSIIIIVLSLAFVS